MRLRLLVLLLLGAQAGFAAPVMRDEGPIYFSKSWCPSKAEVSVLAQAFDLTMDGCCISVAVPKGQDRAEESRLRAAFDDRIPGYKDTSFCVGTNKEYELEQQRETDLKNKRIEKFIKDEADARTELLVTEIKQFNADEACQYAAVVRRWEIDIDNLSVKNLKAIEAALSFRMKTLNVKLNSNYLGRGVFIGMGRCELVAILGNPTSVETTVTSQEKTVRMHFGGRVYAVLRSGKLSSITY